MLNTTLKFQLTVGNNHHLELKLLKIRLIHHIFNNHIIEHVVYPKETV